MQEFNSDDVCRARWGTTIVSGAEDKDTSGHGTHVAGTIVGHTCGVAKQAQVIAVKVFPDGKDVSTSNSNVMKGVEWSFHDAGQNIRRSVANMSLGGPKSQAMNDLIKATVNAGLAIVVASGNKTVSDPLTRIACWYACSH